MFNLPLALANRISGWQARVLQSTALPCEIMFNVNSTLTD
jgi:hypothetical protein